MDEGKPSYQEPEPEIPASISHQGIPDAYRQPRETLLQFHIKIHVAPAPWHLTSLFQRHIQVYRMPAVSIKEWLVHNTVNHELQR